MTGEPKVEVEHEAVVRFRAGTDLSDERLPKGFVRDAIGDALLDGDGEVVSVKKLIAERELDPVQAEEELGLEDVPPDQRWDKDGAF